MLFNFDIMFKLVENIDINGERPYYWIVGSCYGGESKRDNFEKFIKEGRWEDGWGVSGNDKNKKFLLDIKKGDYLLLKSSFAIKNITYTRLKAIGIVKAKSASNFYSFLITWYDDEFLPKDFANISYRKTIEIARKDILLDYAKGFIKSLNQ